MKIRLSAISFAVMVAAVFSGGALAQDPSLTSAAGDKYVISAKAGGVNYVEGSVGLVRKSGSGARLLKGDTLEIGDRVSTGTDGKAEILLNPGSYVRLGGDSAFEFKTTTLEDLQLLIDRGSAILEVFAGDDFVITVRTPKATFKLINSGVFRIDVGPDRAGTVSVFRGRAMVGSTENGIVKAGRSMTVSGGSASVAKFDRDENDDLEIWSKQRGKHLAKMTNSLQRRELRGLLSSSFLGGQWNMYNSFGLWVFNRYTGTYCFLPFGYGWYSPYGYGFNQNIYWYDIPWTVPAAPQGQPTGSTPPSGPIRTPIVTAGDRSPIPPFVRMSQINGSGSRPGTGEGPIGTEISSPPIYAPPPVRFDPPKADPPVSVRPPSQKDGN